MERSASTSSSSSSSSSAPRSPTASAHGVAEAEVEEDRGSLGGEHASPLYDGDTVPTPEAPRPAISDSGDEDDRHSLRDTVPTPEAPRPTINDSGEEDDPPALGETLPRTEPEGDPADATLICESVQQDVPSGISDGSQDGDASSSGLPSTIIAEPRAPAQSVQEPGLPATALGDDQYIVERLLGKQDVPRGRGRRRRMVAQYKVKWEGWSDEYNQWVDEDDIHEDLVAAYNPVTT